MSQKKIAVIQFPGSNCERETLRALSHAAHDVSILRWNCTQSEFQSFDAYVLPGGFSYQDRVRAGAIAAKLPIVKWLRDANNQGKAILGICNGCQILAEAGLVPDVSGQQILEVALTHNQLSSSRAGFMCDWVYVKITNAKHNIFTSLFEEGAVLPIPVNHGEGRFVLKSKDDSVFKQVTYLQYCDSRGDVSSEFPITPNGSEGGIAGLGNTKGNVLAMMPHPERAESLKQLPRWVRSESEKPVSESVWAPLFQLRGVQS